MFMKTIYLILLSIFFCVGLKAQPFSVGASLGLLSSISSDYMVSEADTRRNSYFLGLNLAYQPSKRVSFHTGLQYLRLGYQNPTCYQFDAADRDYLLGQFDYLALPLSASIHLLPAGKLRLSFGLVGAVNIRARQDYAEPIGGCERLYAMDMTAVTRPFALHGLLGVGYSIWASEKLEWVAAVHYQQGLSNVYQNPLPNRPTAEREITYSAALISMSLYYKLGRKKAYEK